MSVKCTRVESAPVARVSQEDICMGMPFDVMASVSNLLASYTCKYLGSCRSTFCLGLI